MIEIQETHNTPTGGLWWCKVFRPDPKFNEYGLELNLSESDAGPMIQMIRETLANFQLVCEQKKENIKGFASPPFSKLEDGSYRFKFKEKFEGGPNQKGEMFSLKPDVLDSQLNKWPDDLLIGNGSLGQVCFYLWPWNVAIQGGLGCTLKLKALQVLTHVPYVPPLKTHGFQEQDGVDITLPNVNESQEPGPAGTPSDIPIGKLDETPKNTTLKIPF